jgi:hypothetical protein
MILFQMDMTSVSCNTFASDSGPSCINYILGRDNIVSSIVGSASNGSGTTSYNGVTYLNSVEYVSGLLTPGSSGTSK